MSERAQTHLALATVSFLFGTSYVLTKIILASIPAHAWAFYRLVIASLTLAPFLFTQRFDWVALLKNPRLWVCGLFGIALNQLLFAEGLQRTIPSHSSLINATIPAITLVIAIAARAERWNARRAFGIACAMAGVFVLIALSDRAGQTGSNSTLTGDLLTLANVCSFSLFLVISRPLAKGYPAAALTGYYVIEGALLLGINLAVRAILEPSSQPLTTLTRASLKLHLLMVLVAVTSTTFTYLLNNWALKRAAPSQVAAYITLQPIVATTMAYLFYDQKIPSSFLPAFCLVVAGVTIAALQRRPTVAS